MAHKIYASSSAFLKGKLVFSQYSSGCLRSILIKSKGYREPEISSSSSSLGARNEERFEQQLKREGRTYLREDPVSYPLDAGGNVVFSGRRDFVIDPGTRNEIVELKATSSKTKLQMMKEGRFAPENLAQLVAYMVEAASEMGRLIYSYYKGPYEDEPALQSEYVVTIDPSGDILANGRHSSFAVADYFAHRDQAAALVSSLEPEIPDRPHNYDATFGSPCQYCVFRPACDKFDRGESQLLPAVESLQGVVKR